MAKKSMVARERKRARTVAKFAGKRAELKAILKDASAFNVQFESSRALFIDTLSFERYVEGEPWVAYDRFCRQFLAPLAPFIIRTWPR